MAYYDDCRHLPAATRRGAPDANPQDAPHLIGYSAIAFTAMAFALVIADVAPLLAIANNLWWAVMPAILALALVAPRLTSSVLLVNGWMMAYASLWGFLMAPILAEVLTPNATVAVGAAVFAIGALALASRRGGSKAGSGSRVARVFGAGAISLIVAMFGQELLHVGRTLPL